MRLIRLGPVGQERPAVLDDSGIAYDATPVTRDYDGAFFAAGGIDSLRAALQAAELSVVDAVGMRVGAPVARPAAVICIGQNYAAHAAESGAAPTDTPIVFFKHPNTVVGPHDDVHVPPQAQKVDWEVELAVVIGRTTSYLSGPDQALDCIAGFAITNDVSERAYQLEQSGGQWSKGKCAPTFNPLGPWLVPTADIEDVQALQLFSWVNGAPRQASSTADMIFDVAHLINDLSQYMTLEAGDVINTGTPEGVALSGRFPYLRAGDVMELEITGLGRQRQTLR